MALLTWPSVRSIVLASLIVSSAISTSASVWHLSLSEYGSQLFSLDIYVILISALTLLGISSIVFFELALPDPHDTPLSLEFSWASLLFVADLAAAVAVSSLSSDMMCWEGTASVRPLDMCVAQKLLLAFLWVSTVIALVYTLTLTSFIIRARGKNFSSWRCAVRNLHWSGPVHCLESAPASPTSRPRFQSSLIVAPQPRPAQRPLEAFRSGLGSEYEIEHYQPPPPVLGVPTETHPSALYYADHVKNKVEPPSLPTPAPSPPPVTEPNQVREERQSIRPLPHFPPPPLGDWPRSDAIVRESTKKRGKRREIVPEDEPPSVPSPPAPAPPAPVVTRPPPVSISVSPPRSKPLGPRLSGERRTSGDMPWR